MSLSAMADHVEGHRSPQVPANSALPTQFRVVRRACACLRVSAQMSSTDQQCDTGCGWKGANLRVARLSSRIEMRGLGGNMRARGTAATLLAAVCMLVSGTAAKGAQYKVSACGPNAAFQNHLLTASVSESRMSAYTACPNDGSGHQVGVAALAGIDRGTVPIFANALQSFIAPAGTTISHVHLK